MTTSAELRERLKKFRSNPQSYLMADAFAQIAADAIAALEAAEVDTARLDWMLKTVAFVAPATVEGMWLCGWLNEGGISEEISEPYRQPRQAIDAAMNRQALTPPQGKAGE